MVDEVHSVLLGHLLLTKKPYSGALCLVEYGHKEVARVLLPVRTLRNRTERHRFAQPASTQRGCPGGLESQLRPIIRGKPISDLADAVAKRLPPRVALRPDPRS